MESFNYMWQKDLKLLQEHLPISSQSRTLLILKGHLILEDQIRRNLLGFMKNSNQFDKCRLKFSQMLQLVRCFHSRKPNEWFWNGAIELNTLRNKLAHNLKPRDLLQQINKFTDLIFHQSKSLRDGNLKSIFEAESEFMKLAISISTLCTAFSAKFHEHIALGEALRIGTVKADEP
jgi:hypothetical protein